MLYFTYGSNLDWPQMKSRAPSARFLARAILKDHKLAFTRKSLTRGCGSADAVPAPGSEVWGVVYEMVEQDFEALDRAEEFVPGRERNGYTRRQHEVYLEGDEKRPLVVWLYFAEKEKGPPLPSAHYKGLIVGGARHWRLPEDYIAALDRIETA